MMDATRREHVRSIVGSLDGTDLDYTETALHKAYALEIDRKDKILSSMTVVSTPLTILFAGVAFLTNTFLDATQGILTSDPDVLVAAFYLVAVIVLVLVASVLINAARLLGGESYYYLPNADDLLESIARNKDYCLANGLVEDGQASRFVRQDTISQLAECTTRNALANDIRLTYRQRVFSRTVWAIVFAAIGFVLIAWHHQKPDIVSVSDIWREWNARPAQGTVKSGLHGSESGRSQTERGVP